MRILIASLVILSTLSFTYKNKKFKNPEKSVFIPSGTTEHEGQAYSCEAFWMLDHEVTNFEYFTFLKQLLTDGKTGEYKKAVPDTLAWKSIGGYMNPMAEYYFSHPSYANYPVVNVSKEGAELFCVYMTKEYRAIYGEAINDFRLPTKLEWIYAAKGGTAAHIYPWSGPHLRNADGELMANFYRIGDENSTYTSDGPQIVSDSARIHTAFADDAYVTAPANSYWPNEYGLYNMAGNVAELVADENTAMGGHWRSTGYDIRVTSQTDFEKANPFVGFRPVMAFLVQE